MNMGIEDVNNVDFIYKGGQFMWAYKCQRCMKIYEEEQDFCGDCGGFVAWGCLDCEIDPSCLEVFVDEAVTQANWEDLKKRDREQTKSYFTNIKGG